MKNDPEIIKIALENDISAIQWASEEMKKNIAIMKFIVILDP